MLYAVIAYEAIYGGLHGMVDYFIVDGTEEDAESQAQEASYEIMHEYHDIEESLRDAATGRWEDDNDWDPDEDGYPTEEDIEEYLMDEEDENLAYEIYPIVKETNLSLEQLDNLFYRNPEDFIREYCNLPNFSNGYR